MAQTCVEVFSRETIKPSSPTPQNLQKFKLSYLDQLVDPLYVSLIFLYQTDAQAVNNNRELQIQKSQRLKKSLSHTLTIFYPFAGRIQDNFTIDCNDAGVEFIDARAIDHTQLIDAIQEQPNNINEHHLKQYLPVDPTTKSLFLVQITYFDCGGVVVGVRFSHRVADCASIMDFINAWAHANETDDIPTLARPISFDLANYFPGMELTSFDFFMAHDEKFRTKRLVFDKVRMEALRQLADSSVMKPTRVELVSAFIWKSFIQFSSSAGENNNNKICCAGHAVNLRARKKSLENVFGNCVMMAFAFEESSSGGGEFHEVVSKLRNAMRRVDEDYITKTLQQSGDEGYLNDLNELGCIFTKRPVEKCVFTSWCKFPFYEADFGWGKPILFCPGEVPNNLAMLVDGRCGETIEVWLNMNQDALSILEANFKLI